MGTVYRLMYAVGFTPWDRAVAIPLRELIEGPDALPAGRALDLGSGMGTKSVYMAAHGWDVTGVEFVPRALKEARRRAQAAGVKVDFREGDVTRLGYLGLTPGFSLLFDFGCYHGLKRDQRARYAEGVTALAAPGATLLMMAFTKPCRRSPRGSAKRNYASAFGRLGTLPGQRPASRPARRP